jgi:Fe2+ transport system protein B
MLLYLIGFNGNILSLHSKYYSKKKCKTFFVVEMPSYKPLFKNVALNVIEKQKHLFLVQEK